MPLYPWLVWRSGNGVRHINEVEQLSYTSSPVSTGIGDRPLAGLYHTGVHPGHSSPLSLAIPPWVSATSNGHAFNHFWGKTAPLKLRPHSSL